jgi:replicative superfamily II helicase
LTVDEREVIEDAYKKRIITILFATSTLAAGDSTSAMKLLLMKLKGLISQHGV